MDTVSTSPADVTEPRPVLPPPPLLPPLLLSPASFLWLWVLPIAVLLALNVQGYWVVEGNMTGTQRELAWHLGWCGVGNLLAGLACYAFARWGPPYSVTHPAWGIPALVVQGAVLWVAVYVGEDLLPRSVTAWIYPEPRYLFNQFAFGMLPLFLGILRIGCARVAGGDARKAFVLNLALAVGCPLALYLMFHAVASVSSHASNYEWIGLVLVSGIVVLGLLMFIGLTRMLVLGFRAVQHGHPAWRRGLVVAVALVLPLTGLLLNRTIPFPVDFQAWETYALTVANAAVLMLATWRREARPRLNWHLLCATFPFASYFFLVFLPYTPLSILALIAVGTGMLVLTPIILFVLHLHLLHEAWRQVGGRAARVRLVAGGLLCGLLLPAFFAGRALADRAALNAALDYAYSPSIPAGDITYGASVANLRRALASHRAYKNGIYYPILSDFYAWAVFDNLVLPDDKLAQLEKLFLGSPGGNESGDPVRNRRYEDSGVRARGRMPRAVPPPRVAELDRLAVRVALADGSASVVTASLTLRNDGAVPAEFHQVLPLPGGVFVTGFRLQVGDKLVPGRIFEKKTALWVYTMIRDSERRDPGLLFYRSPTELELLVFPVSPSAKTTVEIDYLVPGGVDEIDLAQRARTLDGLGRGLALAVPGPRAMRANSGEWLVAGVDAAALPAVDREPYLHLIIDRSQDNGFDGSLAGALAELHRRYPAARLGRVTLANHDVTDLVRDLTPLDRLPAGGAGQWRHVMPEEGSLALDLALAHALRLHRDADLDRAGVFGQVPPRPIFVILSRHAAPRELTLKLTDAWSNLLPGLELVEWGADQSSFVHRAAATGATPLLRLGASRRPALAGRWLGFSEAGPAERLHYWSPSRGEWEPVRDVQTVDAGTPWGEAAGLQLLQQAHARNPGGSGVVLADLVRASRESGVLLPTSSYIVVENSAQWKMLELSERQKLGQNAALEFRETPAPPAVWVALAFGLWLMWRRRKERPGRAQFKAWRELRSAP